MENQTQPNVTTTTEQPATAPVPQLGLNDLGAVVQLIDVCSKRGAFEGAELATVGGLRTRFVDFLKANTPKDQAGTTAPSADGAATTTSEVLPVV